MTDKYINFDNVVRDLADEVRSLVEDDGTEVDEAIHEVVDGTEYVIYTDKARNLICNLSFTQIDNAWHDYKQYQGNELPKSYLDVQTGLAYAALRQGVSKFFGV